MDKKLLLNETARTYSFPSRVKFVGEDLVLTTRDFFVILTGQDVKTIKEKVIGENKMAMLQNDTLWLYMKDNYVIIEQKKPEDFQRVLMVNSSVFA